MMINKAMKIRVGFMGYGCLFYSGGADGWRVL